MDRIVIERNGVRHLLTNDGGRAYECSQCSLNDICRDRLVSLCMVFVSEFSHFEVETEKDTFIPNLT